jgi:argininosuccinate lyase
MKRHIASLLVAGFALSAVVPCYGAAEGTMQRLKKGPAKEVVEFLTEPVLNKAIEDLFLPISRINKAHVVMLAEQKILTDDDAREILTVLSALEEEPSDALPWNEAKDLYMNVESWVIDRSRDEVGGKIHIGRSRNDLYATAYRMAIRNKIQESVETLIELKKQELALAEQHVDTIMPGYTHLQHAQPITLGHYLVGHAHALSRDIERLEQAYAFTNLNPLGAAALATTGFPIDRMRTTELLGFSEPIGNSLDAVASRDYVLDVLSALAITLSDISRLAEELILWNTLEFRMAEAADEYASTSSIMPQKKNPTSLEHCRAKAGHVYGSLMAALTMVKGLPFMHSRDTGTEIYTTLWPAFEQFTVTVKLITGVLATLEVKRDVMAERSGQGFTAATELTDLIVKEKNLSFRTAHHIVAEVVAMIMAEGEGPEAITTEMIDEAAQALAHTTLNLDDQDVRAALDPRQNVEARNVLGGPAPARVREAIRRLRNRLATEEAALGARAQQLVDSQRRLEEAARRYQR